MIPLTLKNIAELRELSLKKDDEPMDRFFEITHCTLCEAYDLTQTLPFIEYDIFDIYDYAEGEYEFLIGTICVSADCIPPEDTDTDVFLESLSRLSIQMVEFRKRFRAELSKDFDLDNVIIEED